MLVTLRARFNPTLALAIALVLGGSYAMIRDSAPSDERRGCEPEEAGCLEAASAPNLDPTRAATLRAETACVDVGYLCAELESTDRIRVQRWKDFDGTLVVHVPRPDFEDSQAAVQLQRAAASGIRTWNEAPFPILVDLRGDRDPHFSVQWRRTLAGSQIGVARTRWSPSDGLSVVSIELATRNPFRPEQVTLAAQVRLTAAHEMGHALGLPHSDSDHDVMYPTNTAGAVSAQDRRTMEMLYRLADGTEIIR